MTCCGLKIKEPRNADLRRTYTPQAGYDFSQMTARMQVRMYEGAPDPALLTITMSATPNGSVFTVVGTSMVLTIKKADLEALPVSTPINSPAVFVYDIILTDPTGFENKFLGGQFIMTEGVTR